MLHSLSSGSCHVLKPCHLTPQPDSWGGSALWHLLLNIWSVEGEGEHERDLGTAAQGREVAVCGHWGSKPECICKVSGGAERTWSPAHLYRVSPP